MDADYQDSSEERTPSPNAGLEALQKLVRQNSRALIQVNLKLSELIENTGPRAERATTEQEPLDFDLLADVIDGLDGAIAALRGLSSAAGERPSRWWHIGRAPSSASALREGTDDVRKGLEIVLARVLDVLADHDIVPVARVGRFDPKHHHVIGTEPYLPNGETDGEIVKTIRRGYIKAEPEGERVLRSALVIVGRETEEERP